MSQHKLLIGDGAGKYLPFAREHLRGLRKRLSLLRSYQNTVLAPEATIRVSWAGNEEHIRIVAGAEDWVVQSRSTGKVFTSKHVQGGFRRLGALFIGSPIIPAGARTGALLASVGSNIFRFFSIDLSFGTVTGKATLPNTFVFQSTLTPFHFLYAGLARDEDGLVTGKRFVVINEESGGVKHVYWSVDAGESFATYVFPLPAGHIQGPDMEVLSAVFCGKNTICTFTRDPASPLVKPDFVSVSIDGGASFTPEPASALTTFLTTPPVFDPPANKRNYLFRFVSIGNDKVLAVSLGYQQGQLGKVFLSLDNGATFNIERTPIPLTFEGLLTLGPRRVAVLGNDGMYMILSDILTSTAICIRTLDAADTWEQVPSPVGGISSLHLGTPSVFRLGSAASAGLAVPVWESDKWHLYLSQDAGESWAKGAFIDDDISAPATPFEDDFQGVIALGSFGRPAAPMPALSSLYSNPVL